MLSPSIYGQALKPFDDIGTRPQIIVYDLAESPRIAGGIILMGSANVVSAQLECEEEGARKAMLSHVKYTYTDMLLRQRNVESCIPTSKTWLL